MKLSIVTGTMDRPLAFQRMLESVCDHAGVDWELIVADASEKKPVSQPRHFRVRVLRESPRLGCSKGYNRAFRETRGEYVLWLNDDCEVLPGFDTEAIQFMEENRKIGLGALYYAEYPLSFHVNAYFDMVYANFGILKREFGEQIGWFDEDFSMYGSDNALAFRVLLAGKGIAGIPKARVIHHAERDENRIRNNHYDQRITDVERLTRKYAPVMAQMRETYRNTGSSVDGRDQTPDWVNELLNA